MTDETTATTATEKVPADAPGYPLGGPVPKTRERLIAEQEVAAESSGEREAIDAEKEKVKAEAENPPAPAGSDPLA